MTAPAGIIRKNKDCSKKNFRAHEEWQKAKKLGRPAQQFNVETNTWGKVLEPRKVTA
jgi:hypothetical protein